MVTDVGGLGDARSTTPRTADCSHSRAELDAYIKVLQSKSAADYQPNLTVLSEGALGMIYAIGFLMGDDRQQVAAQFPRAALRDHRRRRDPPNVMSITFKEEEGSYLAGALAAMVSKTQHLAFIGGIDIPLIRKFEAGYTQACDEIDPSIKVDVKYIGIFDDVAAGKESSNLLFNGGADIVYTAAGKAGFGAIEAAKRRNGDYIIGVDNNQDDCARQSINVDGETSRRRGVSRAPRRRKGAPAPGHLDTRFKRRRHL